MSLPLERNTSLNIRLHHAQLRHQREHLLSLYLLGPIRQSDTINRHQGTNDIQLSKLKTTIVLRTVSSLMNFLSSAEKTLKTSMLSSRRYRQSMNTRTSRRKNYYDIYLSFSLDKHQLWFTQLGSERRRSLQHWEDWQNSLRNAFYLLDHIDSLHRQCQYRHYKLTESVSEYFRDKQSLQRYLYSPETPDKTLIQDMVMGLPSKMKPFVKAMIRSDTMLEDFRRILIDLEPAFRTTPTSKSSTQYSSKWKDSAESTTTATGTKKAFIAQVAPRNTYSTDRPPPSPCPICKGNHWRRVCPRNPTNPAYRNNNAPKSNVVNTTQRTTSKSDMPNRTTTNRNNA
jgi:hypothetical protein